MPGPHPTADCGLFPAVHGKPALGCGRTRERSHGGLENPTGGEQRELQSFQLCLGQDWSHTTRSTPMNPLPASGIIPAAPSPQKHQTNCESRESTTNSSSTASPTGSRCQHRALNGPIWETGDQKPSGSAQQSCPRRQQSCPCQPPVLQRDVPWHTELQGCCRRSPAPARIPCRHRRNTPEPSRVTTTALGQVLYQRDSQGALGPSLLPPS